MSVTVPMSHLFQKPKTKTHQLFCVMNLFLFSYLHVNPQFCCGFILDIDHIMLIKTIFQNAFASTIN